MTAGIGTGLINAPLPLMFLPAAAGAACIFYYGKSRLQKYYFFQIFLFFLLFIVGFFTAYIHENYDNRIISKAVQTENYVTQGNVDVDTMHISATVEKVVDGTYSKRLMLEKCSINGKRLVNNIVLEISDTDSPGWWAQRGDYIEIELQMDTGDAVLPLPDAATNPGQFDSRQYYKSLGYAYYIKKPNVILLKRGQNLIVRGLERFKASLKTVYALCCTPTDAGVYEAMVTGDRTDMDSTTKDLFTAAGIGHILAISGLHISLIGMGVYKLLRRGGFMQLISAVISGSIVVLFGVMTGNSISAIRAIVMFVCAVIAQVLGRKYDILSAVSLSAIIIMLKNPYVIANSGFLLSFMAIAGVAVVSEGFSVKWLKWFTGPVAIQLATLPVMLWFYYEIPVYSVFLNLLVVPLMSLIMISAVGCGLLGLVSIPLGSFFAGMGHYILVLFRYGCKIMLSLPGSVFVAGRPKMWQVVVYYILLILFSMRKDIVKYLTNMFENLCNVFITVINITLRGMFVLAVFVLLVRNRSGLEVTFLDVGQGDAIFINMPNGGNVFIDGGSTSSKNIYDKVIEPFLKFKGVRKIDFLFITHSDADHENGWSEAVEDVNTGNVKQENLGYIPTIYNLVLNESDFAKYEAAVKNKKYLEALLMAENVEGFNLNEDFGLTGSADKSGLLEDVATAESIEGIAIRMENIGTQILCSQYLTKYMFDECSITSLNGSLNGSGLTGEFWNGDMSGYAAGNYSARSYSSDSENDNSIVLLLEYNGFSMLFTGDMTSKKEAFVAEGIKKCGVDSLSLLKVGHHGSKYSSDEAFLASTMPQITVISCAAQNSYGHPHREVLERLENIGAAVIRTDHSGAVITKIDDRDGQMLVFGYSEK